MAKTNNLNIDVTVAVPTYNGDDYIEDLISAVLNQKTKLKYELIIIDSGSKDKTVEIAKSFKNKLRLHEIPNKEFGHGKTRNLAASMASGKFIVFLSQDAVPANSRWLDGMIEPFMLNDNVYCVVGKQKPRAFTDATTKREVTTVFNSLGPDHSLMVHRGKSILDKSDYHQKLTFFSDVNSAVRLDYLLNKIPYRDVPYSEDQLLGHDVLEAGYLKIYAPDGLVEHSNDYPIGKYFSRRIDEYSAMYQVLGVVPEGRFFSLTKLLILETFRDYVFIYRDKDYSLIRKIIEFTTSPIRNFEKLRASYVVFKNLGRTDKLSKYSLEKRDRD